MYNNIRRVSVRAPTLPTAEDDILLESKDRDGVRKDMWSSMLDSVASGKRLPETSVLVLGWL